MRTPIADIVHIVAHVTGVEPDEILSKTRRRPVAQARQLVMYIAYKRGHTLKGIGRALGRHHSTVIHGRDKTDHDSEIYLKQAHDYSAAVKYVAMLEGIDLSTWAAA